MTPFPPPTPSIEFEIACQCGDFAGSHRNSDGACYGWCDQTCTAYRPVEMAGKSNLAWQAVLAKATELGMPRLFTGDLFRDWELLTAADAPAHGFLWGVRSTGTNVLPLDGGRANLNWFNAIHQASPHQIWFAWTGPLDAPGYLSAVSIDDARRLFLASGRVPALERTA